MLHCEPFTFLSLNRFLPLPPPPETLWYGATFSFHCLFERHAVSLEDLFEFSETFDAAILH